MRRSAFGGTVLIALVLVAGVWAKQKVNLNAPDTAAARSTLITRADLRPPTGWKGGPVKPNLSQDSCSSNDSLVLTGAAENDWSRSDRLVDSYAAVLQTAGMVMLDFHRSATAASLRCTLVHAGATSVRVTPVEFPKLGDVSVAFRVNYKLSGHRQVAEITAVGQGRTEATLVVVFANPAPLATLHAETVRLARIMTNRIKV
jgi:hypothetical protein